MKKLLLALLIAAPAIGGAQDMSQLLAEIAARQAAQQQVFAPPVAPVVPILPLANTQASKALLDAYTNNLNANTAALLAGRSGNPTLDTQRTNLNYLVQAAGNSMRRR